MTSTATNPASNLPAYFNKLAASYPVLTGRSTEKLFAQLLPRIASIDSSSIIHDNASGPATATSVLLSDATISAAGPKVLCTDMSPAMIEGVNDVISAKDLQNVEAKIMKSDDDMDLQSDYFTHSITNFSIFNFTDRVKATSEIYRTLQPGGQVIITTWQRFGPGDIIHEVQKRIRPDLPLMKYSGEDMYDDQAVLKVMIEGGFSGEKLEVVTASYEVKGDDLQGLTAFVKGPFTNAAKEGWTDAEKGRYNDEMDKVIRENSESILFEMFAIIGTK